MACEVPVIASRVGGLPEVIEHGVSGFLHPLDAIDEMAASRSDASDQPALHKQIAQAACHRVRSEFCVERVVPNVRSVLSGIADVTPFGSGLSALVLAHSRREKLSLQIPRLSVNLERLAEPME